MKIIGVDFTSSPSRQKPITSVTCNFTQSRLLVESFEDLATFDDFEQILTSSGPWVAGMDFPFGQSRRLVENIGWPQSWANYVSMVGLMSKEEYEQSLNAYKSDRAPRDKEHLRETDRLAGSKSPQKLYGVPVGKCSSEVRRDYCQVL